ncbi:FAD:protein FMN transferase [Candidatus Pseudoscillospira sp. SGI.172]|uniref:FAD:protein FMN transferase n=1 Tax=Candidatus Pseudoscillospira sp. SGI.172 TaxID=3420582 RepID=UPI003D092FC2
MKSKVTLVVFLLLLLSGCGNQAPTETPDQLQTATVFAMDTVMDLTIYGSKSVLEKAESRISELEEQLSVTDESSEIYRLNHTGSGVVSADTSALLEQSLDLCKRTKGALDISIYPVVRAWGFTTDSYEVPSGETISALLEHVDYRAIQYDAQSKSVSLLDGMEIDLGSVAKGYTSDVLIELLRESGVESALLNLGGNVHALGGKPDGSPWRVAIQDPQSDVYFGVLEIRDQAVVTSGGYERYFEQDGNIYWHIIDPATGYPARSGLLSVTIVGDSGVICDGLSTSLFVMGLEDAAAFWRSSDDFEAIFMDESGNIAITEGLDGCFSLADSYSQNGLTVLRCD